MEGENSEKKNKKEAREDKIKISKDILYLCCPGSEGLLLRLPCKSKGLNEPHHSGQRTFIHSREDLSEGVLAPASCASK